MSRPTSPGGAVLVQDGMDMDERRLSEQTQDPTEEPAKAKSKKLKAPEILTREPGKSFLPHARVQKIMKADKDLIMVQREAAFLISRATEEFVQRIAEAAQQVSERERRSTVQAKDLIASIRRADEFAFLEELLPYMEPEPAAPGRSKARAKDDNERGKLTGQNTLLDQFVQRPAKDGASLDEDGAQTEVITHQDGTMEVVPVGAPS